MSEFSFWFTSNPPLGDFILGYMALGFFIFLLLLPSFLKSISIKNKYLKKSIKKRLWPFLVIGGLGILLILIQFSEVGILSRPIYLLLVFITGIVLMFYLIFKILRDYRKRLNSVVREKNKRV